MATSKQASQDAGGRQSAPWWEDPAGDLTIRRPGMEWKMKSTAVRDSGWFLTHLSNNHLRAGGFIDVPDFCKPESECNHVLHHVLRFLHHKEYDCTVWENKRPSFLSCVHSYFVADYFDVPSLKEEMLGRIQYLSKRVISFNSPDRIYLWSREEPCEEKDHLRSFVRAVKVMEIEYDWRPKLQKALYDAGERMSARLLELDDFQDFLRTERGRDFAIAIGLKKLLP